MPQSKREFNLFRLPQSQNYLKNNENRSSLLVGVIDSSGSMSSVWKHIAKLWNSLTKNIKLVKTIAFSNNAYLINGQISENINDYGGGGTEIFAGFKSLNDILEQHEEVDINIVFVSDGADNNNSTLGSRLQTLKNQDFRKRRIRFLCLGVGSGFPTFLAMSLRENYHTVDSNSPPVFLVENPTFECFEEQFNILSNFLDHKKSLSIQPPVIVIP